MRHRRPCVVAALTAAVALTVLPSAASAAPMLVAKREARDGTTYTVTAKRKLVGSRGDRARFAVHATPADERDEAYVLSTPVASQRLRLAKRQRLVVGSSLDCEAPGASTVYGTVTRRARRVVARLRGGRRMKLKVRQAPKAWRFDGRVIGGVLARRRAVLSVTAYDRRGRRLARATFSNAQDC